MLNYEIRGEGEVVVLVHGLFGSLQNLKALSNHLSKSFKVINLDLPNHGDSLHLGKITIDSMAEKVNELMCHLGLERFCLVGHSLGGKVSMKFSQRYPEKVAKLVIVDIAPVSYSDRHHAVFSALNSIDLNRLESKDSALVLLKKSGLDARIGFFMLQSLIKQEEQFKWRFDLKGIECSYLDLMIWTQGSETYAGPALFIKGELSDYICDEHEVTIQKLFPRASIEVMKGVGHWPHVEKIRDFNDVVNGFL